MAKKIPQAVSAYLKRIGAKGGKAALESMTAEERSKRASRAAKARWRRKK